MKVITIIEEGKPQQYYEGDFICLDQMFEDALEILKPYNCPSAVQYLKLVQHLVNARRQEIFNSQKPSDIEFMDTRNAKK